MTEKQVKKLDIITKANAGSLTVKEAAMALGLSTRQIKRLKKGVKENGAAALVHKNSLKVPANAIPPETKEQILSLRENEPYKSSNFAHFREILSEHFDIEISYGSLYRILRDDGIVSPKKRRKYKKHKRRRRRPQAGLLVQMDATPYSWFDGDRKTYALHGAIDDATGQVISLYMTRHECLNGYFRLLERSIKSFGIPMSIYADRHTIFQSPNKKKAEVDSSVPVNDTQFGKALNALDIELIPANSPQAKGRIERLWDTLQSRLPVEFSLRGISSIEEANDFLSEYIYAYNSEFAVEPENADSMFKGLPDHMDLRYILCCREERTLDAGNVFSFRGKTYKVDERYDQDLPAKAKVTVLAGTSTQDPFVKVAYKNLVFDTLPFVPPKRKPKTKKDTPVKRSISKPGPNHPYNLGKIMSNTMDWTYTDQEILEMIGEAFQRYSP